MVNPFDHNFFKFFFGFVCILCFSFGILFIVGQYSETKQVQQAAVSK